MCCGSVELSCAFMGSPEKVNPVAATPVPIPCASCSCRRTRHAPCTAVCTAVCPGQNSPGPLKAQFARVAGQLQVAVADDASAVVVQRRDALPVERPGGFAAVELLVVLQRDHAPA